MIKLLGAILMVGATTWTGVRAAGALKRRESSARAFAYAMEQMAAQLSFDLALIPSVLESMSTSAPEQTRSFFRVCLSGMDSLGDKPFSAIWEQAVHTATEGLGKAEKETLARAGAIIGRYGLDSQLDALMSCVNRLRRLADEAALEAGSKARVYTALGVCSGLMAVLVLI